MHDPTIPLNCPYCGARVRRIRTEGETHFYRCQKCGPLALPPDGWLRRVHLPAGKPPPSCIAIKTFTYRHKQLFTLERVGSLT